MPDISVVQIIDTIKSHELSDTEAEVLLGVALDELSLPVKDFYSPTEVMAIGTQIADSQLPRLRDSDVPLAIQLEVVVEPLITALKADHLERQPHGAFTEEQVTPAQVSAAADASTTGAERMPWE